jgi:hypothetical protein
MGVKRVTNQSVSTVKPPILNSAEGGLVSEPGGCFDVDSTYDFASSVQLQIAPRADSPGPWYLHNLGSNTVYYGPTGVTSATGTAVTSGNKSASISGSVSTFVVCAAGQTSTVWVSTS